MWVGESSDENYSEIFFSKRIIKLFFIIFTAIVQSNAISIRCEFNYYTWPIIDSQYFCYHPVLSSDGNNAALLSVNGLHLSGKSNAVVKVFVVFGDPLQLSRLPGGIENFFPFLIGLQWKSGHLTAFTADDIKPFPDLQVLSINSNKIASLDGNLFQYTPKLKFVSFGDNSLVNVGYNILQGLNGLTSAYFYSNPCISVAAETSTSIEDLKLQLQIQCPPLAQATAPTTTISPTTASAACSGSCLTFVEDVLTENVRLNTEILSLNAEILKLKVDLVLCKFLWSVWRNKMR